jgi:hypothetical protein
MEESRAALLSAIEAIRAQPWADEVALDQRLVQLGHAASGGVVAAVNMARRDEANVYGVPGMRWSAAEAGKPSAIGCGQHGGWGADETRPFLLLNTADLPSGVLRRPSSLVDIAPTILAFLGLPHEGLDGAPLYDFQNPNGAA